MRSHFRSIPGYGDQIRTDVKSVTDHRMQEDIFNFLIQTVRDNDAFDKLLTVESKMLRPDEGSTRGREAWMVLKEHYEQVGTYRLHDLMTDFMRP